MQRLLRLLTRIGDYVGAIRAYHGLQQLLQSAFNVAPSVETTRLAAEIRERLNADGPRHAAPEGRRSINDRRFGPRRTEQRGPAGSEKRKLSDRRRGERRSGTDRRLLE